MGRFNNPVLEKEFKLRFRTGKSFLGLLFYLASIAIVVTGTVTIQFLSSNYGYLRPAESRSIFYFLSLLQLVLVLFMTPGLTAGAVSGEREKQTLNILLTTTQSSFSIIIGKLIASVSYMLVLLFSSLPFYSFVFLYGGISPGQLLSVFFLYLVNVLAIGGLGVMFSTLIRKTVVSMITTYGVMLFLSLGTAILAAITTALGNAMNSGASFHPVPYAFTALNPFACMLSILEPSALETMGIQFFHLYVPLWIPFILVYSGIFVLTLFVAVKRLRPKMKS